MERKLKIVLCIAIIILIVIVSFVGVYTKDGVLYKSSLPDYTLSSDFAGKRITNFRVNKGTQEVIHDKDGKEVDSIPEGANEEEYTKEEKKINEDGSLNTENYKKVKEIFERKT